MVIRAYAVPGKAKSDMICKAFLAGAPKHAEGAVFFGTEGQLSAFQKAKTGAAPWWYIDNAYADKHRGLYFRVTKNALQVDPRGKTSDGTRFARLGLAVRDQQRLGGEMTVVVPQSDDFMKSTIGYKTDWTRETVNALSLMGCPHVHVHPWQRDKVARGEEFAKLLHRTRLVVTFSSAAAITALLEGVPAISTSETAAAHWFGLPFTTENVLRPWIASIEDRLTFARVLADNMFTLEEFRSGAAWKWLNK